MKKWTSWYWALPVALVLALVMVAITSWGSGPAAHAQTPTATPNACTGMTISKEANVDEVAEDGEITYTITVEFSGDAECLGLEIDDVIPDDTNCVDATVSSDTEVDIDDEDIDGCDGSGTVTWGIDDNEADSADDGDVAIVEMVLELDGPEDGDEVDNTACIFSGNEEEDCDSVTVDVGKAGTSTPQPTATRQATVQPPPVVAPPVVAPPVVVAAPVIAPPVTGTGSDDSSLPLAATLGLVGAALLLGSGAVLLKRTR